MLKIVVNNYHQLLNHAVTIQQCMLLLGAQSVSSIIQMLVTLREV